MIPSKDKLLYLFLIISIYSSIFLPILQGLSRKLGPTYLLYMNILVQGYIYILPFLLMFLIKPTKQFILIVLLLIYIGISQIFTDYASLSSFFNGYRTYLAVLCYIPIIYHLINHYESFDIKIERHIKILFLITSCIFLFEFFSRYLHNDLYLWFLSLATYKVLALPYSRPLGIGLDIHMQGTILAFATFYFFINKDYKLSFFFFFILFLSGIKTWLIGVTAISMIYYIIYMTTNSFKKVFHILLILRSIYIVFYSQILLILFSTYLLVYPQMIHYQLQLSPSSYVATYMTYLWVNSFDFIIASIIPVGFLSDPDRLSSALHTINAYNDIPILYFGAMIGTFGLLLYMIILYYHLLQKSKYTPLLILSLFSLVHTYYLNQVAIFIIFTYFSLYYIIQNKKNTVPVSIT